MKRFAAVCVACLWLGSHSVLAQEVGKTPGQDPIAEQVFPPELIMRHHKAINLSESQKTAVIGEVKRTQGRIIDVQWELQRALEQMVDLLKQDKVDEQQAIAQLDNVLTVEREIKRAHIALAVRLKYILTPEQQRTLRELRTIAPQSSDPPPRR